MKYSTSGVFFDGLTSVSHEATLVFLKEKSGFAIETSLHQSCFWPINKVRFVDKTAGLELHFGEDPVQFIKIDNQNFINELMAYRKENGQLSLYEKLVSLGIKTHIFLSIIILGFIILSYIFVIPWIGEKTVVLIPDSFDDQLGSMFFEQNTFFDTTDNAKTQTLNLFAQELKLKNKKKLHFIVIDSKKENAFALPDGTIVIYTGILDLMTNYEELVGLIGHEVAHVNQRHSMKMLCRNLSGYLFVSTVLGDANGVMAVVGDNVNTLQSLSFSREFEREADVEGFKIVTENGVNPNGLPKLFKKLNQENPIEIPEFLSSHPITTDRIQYIEDLVKKKGYQTKQNPKLAHLFKNLKPN